MEWEGIDFETLGMSHSTLQLMEWALCKDKMIIDHGDGLTLDEKSQNPAFQVTVGVSAPHKKKLYFYSEDETAWAVQEIERQFPQAWEAKCKNGLIVNLKEYNQQRVVWIRNFQGKQDLKLATLMLLIGKKKLSIRNAVGTQVQWSPNTFIIHSNIPPQEWFVGQSCAGKSANTLLARNIDWCYWNPNKSIH